jgi:hypothetical protein
MPGGDETGPFGDPIWPCRRIWGRRAWALCRLAYGAPLSLTKEEQIEILEAELKEIEAEKQEIEKALKELKKQ